MCAYSVLTPYPGTLMWYQMGKANSIVSYDWDKYDQAHIVSAPGHDDRAAARGLYACLSEVLFAPVDGAAVPAEGSRSRTQWGIYNLFYRKGEVTGRTLKEPIAAPTAAPRHVPNPPILPVKREWREAVLEGLRESRSA